MVARGETPGMDRVRNCVLKGRFMQGIAEIEFS